MELTVCAGIREADSRDGELWVCKVPLLQRILIVGLGPRVVRKNFFTQLGDI